MTKFLDINKQ